MKPAGLPLWRKVALGSGDLGFNIYWQSSSLFLLFFYTDVLGLPAEVAGLIYMLSLVWDAAIDPVIGLLADRTRTSLGRYRPYLILGALPLAAGYASVFMTPPAAAPGAVLLAATAHIAFRTLYAVVSIPYASLFARVTRDSRDRGDMAGVRILFAMIAGVAISSTTLPLVDFFGEGDDRRGWLILSLVYGAFATLMIWSVAWSARGLDAPDVERGISHTPRQLIAALACNRPLHIALGIVVLSALTNTFFQKNILYYFKYVFGDAGSASLALTMMAGVTGGFVPVWIWVARHHGKRFAWVSGLGFTLVGLLLWRAADGQGLTFLLLALAVLSIGTSAGYLCFWAVLPDTVEYGEWRSGIRTEALIFGLVTLAQKAALGFGAGALGFALRAIGYDAGTSMSQATQDGLRHLMLIIPVSGAVLALCLLAFYRLDYATHGRIVDELAAREP